jgi:anti-sigma factor (TIGR02949 family)
MNCQEVMSLLHPLIDGELAESDENKLKAHMHQCPDCRTEFEWVRALQNKIKQIGIVTAPHALRANILSKISEDTSKSSNNWVNFKGLLKPFTTHFGTALLGGMLVFVLMSQPFTAKPNHLEIFDAHIRSLASEQLVAVNSSDQHTVKPWFAGKINFSPDVPDIKDSGFTLLGGRLDELYSKNVAVLVYLRRKHKINVFITPLEVKQGEQPTRWQHHGYNAVLWQDKRFAFAAISDLSAHELDEFAKSMRIAAH